MNVVIDQHDSGRLASTASSDGSYLSKSKDKKGGKGSNIININNNATNVKNPQKVQQATEVIYYSRDKEIKALEKILHGYEKAKLKQAETYLKNNVSNLMAKMGASQSDIDQVQKVLNSENMQFDNWKTMTAQAISLLSDQGQIERFQQVLDQTDQVTSGNINSTGDANGAGDHQVGNFFMVLFEFLKKNINENNEQMVATYNHMESQSTILNNVATQLQKTETQTEQNVQQAYEEAHKHKGLLGLILGVVLAIVTVVVTVVSLGAAAPAAVAADVATEAAVEGATEAATEATAETVAETATEAATEATTEATTDGVANGAADASETATETSADAVEEAEETVEDAAEEADQTGKDNEADNDNSTKEQSKAQKIKAKLIKLGQAIRSNPWKTAGALTTISAMTAGPALGTGIPQTINQDNANADSLVQAYLAEENVTDQIESNISNQVQTVMKQDFQVIQGNTTNEQSDTQIASQTVQQMTSALSLGSV